MASTPPYVYLTSTGTVIVDTSNLLSEVQAEWQTAFGTDLITTPDTPQGVMIIAETSNRAAAAANNAALANQINPNYSGGVFLDALLALTGVERGGQSHTYVSGVTVTGVGGTTIPAGSQARTAVGDIFLSVQAIVIPVGGTTMVDFQSQAFGPIPCLTGELTFIVQGPIGWETVVNTTSGALGVLTQSDQSGRAFRKNTLGYNAISLASAITSALYNVSGVSSLSFRENFNSVPMGLLVKVTGGSTLNGDVFGMTTTSGSGPGGTIVVGTDAINFAQTAQTLPAINPWPVAAFGTTGNIALSGLGTRSGGDWSATLTAGNIIGVFNQTTASQNGVYLAASGAWTRQSFATSGSNIQPSNSGISMVANSVYACVQGGSDMDVAAALLENKSSGAAWNGGTAVNLIEPASGQNYPVLFDRPQAVAILVRVTASNVTQAAVTQAILDYAAGSINGLAGFVVGADVSPFELAGAIMSENPGCYVSSVTISLAVSPSYSTTPIPIALDQISTVTAGDISVTLA